MKKKKKSFHLTEFLLTTPVILDITMLIKLSPSKVLPSASLSDVLESSICIN
ncbi:hypothetical protein Pint_04039 [Pistacia integerrima]|uniref:Uncharacterized protein n=1 Tax=Pistacia integerrima TaxID=434235 RepID=A0ACC0Z8F8_9ROSI|nr:hypothetical protein Pint_04039 [Pistacia integerrima]